MCVYLRILCGGVPDDKCKCVLELPKPMTAKQAFAAFSRNYDVLSGQQEKLLFFVNGSPDAGRLLCENDKIIVARSCLGG